MLAAAASAKLLQSCPTLCDTIDSSPPGSSIPGILQARIVEWVAISFSTALYMGLSLASIIYPPPVSSLHLRPSSPKSLTLVNSFTLCLKPWHHSSLSMDNLRAFWSSFFFLPIFKIFFFSFSTPVISQLSQPEVGFCDNIFASGVWYSIFYFFKLLTPLMSFFWLC